MSFLLISFTLPLFLWHQQTSSHKGGRKLFSSLITSQIKSNYRVNGRGHSGQDRWFWISSQLHYEETLIPKQSLISWKSWPPAEWTSISQWLSGGGLLSSPSNHEPISTLRKLFIPMKSPLSSYQLYYLYNCLLPLWVNIKFRAKVQIFSSLNNLRFTALSSLKSKDWTTCTSF